MLYVSGDTGVFRSLDDGLTWTLFPDESIDGASAQGGNLPRTNITDLDLSLGRHQSGHRDFQPPGALGSLLAHGLGRPRRAAGLDLRPWRVRDQDVAPGPARHGQVNPSNVTGTAADGTPMVDTSQFQVLGLSSFTGFNNATRITIFDVTDNKIIGGFDPSKPSTNVAANWTDGFGNFNIRMNPGASPANGLKVLQIYATDDAGAVGNMITLTITLDASDLDSVERFPPIPRSALNPADNTGVVQDQELHQQAAADGSSASRPPRATVELLYKNGNGDLRSVLPAVITTADATGKFSLTFPNQGCRGPSRSGPGVQQGGAANQPEPAVVFTIKTTGPTSPPTLVLNPYYDSGIVGDNITNVRKPVLLRARSARPTLGRCIRIYLL